MKLLHQILLLIFCPLLLISGIFMHQVNTLLNRLDSTVQEQIQDKAEFAKMHFESALKHTGKIARILATSSEIAEAVEIGDSSQCFVRSSLFIDDEVDYIVFTDTDGIVISRGHEEFSFGDRLLDESMVKSALAGNPNSVITPFENGTYLISFVPVLKFEETIVGMVAVGISVDKAFLNALFKDPKISFRITHNGNEIIKTFNEKSAVQWDSIAFDYIVNKDSRFQITLLVDNRLERANLVKLKNDFMLYTGIFCFLLAIGLTYFIRRMIAPLKTLVTEMQNFPSGSQEAYTPLMSHNAIGELSRAFSKMIVQLKDQQEATHIAENKYRHIFENATEGIFLADQDGSCRNANAALANIFGYSSTDEMRPAYSNIFEVFMADPEVRKQFLEKLDEQGFINNFETDCRTKDGTHIKVSINLHKWFDENLEQWYCEGTLKDITENNKATLAMEEAKEAAISSSQAKSDFLANMSHEIRTPMNGLIGAAEIALDESMPPKVEEFLRIIHSSALSLLRIINDILDFSKIEAGKLELEAAPFSLNQMLKTIEREFATKLEEKHIELSINIKQGTPSAIIGDSLRLRQIVINLLGNAIKFTPEKGTIAIDVSSQELDPEEAKLMQPEDTRDALTDEPLKLLFVIKDSGIGIKPDALGSLFDSFTQAEKSTTRKYGGTGLGLAISKQLVEIMNGKIWAESEYTKGTAFNFFVLLNKKHQEAEEGLTEKQTSSMDQLKALTLEDYKSSVNGIRVLVAEDNRTNQAIVKAILKSAKVVADIANNGQEAVDALQKAQYDLVLMDMQMPVMDGYEATRTIRKKPEFASLPIIAMTAHAMKGDEQKCIDAGMNSYITKPINRNTFFKVLSEQVNPDTATREVISEKVVPEQTASITPTALEIDFQKNNHDMFGKIMDTFDAGNIEELLLLATSLKTSSDTIGALKVKNISSRIEKLCKEKKEVNQFLIFALGVELNNVLKSFEPDIS